MLREELEETHYVLSPMNEIMRNIQNEYSGVGVKRCGQIGLTQDNIVKRPEGRQAEAQESSQNYHLLFNFKPKKDVAPR